MKYFDIIQPYLRELPDNFRRLFGPFNFRILLMPLAISAFLWIGTAYGIIKPQKPPLEIAAVVVSALLMLIAAVRYFLTRQPFFLWSSALFLLIMCREIHFAGTDAAIFIGLVILWAMLLYKYEKFEAYAASPWVINLLGAGFFTYFLSQTVDQRWWRMIPAEDIVHVPLEESLEMLGHILIGLAAVLCRGHNRHRQDSSLPTA
jgi:hypothetical protein